MVEIYYKYELIASHERLKRPHHYTTDTAHMATFNLQISEWNPERFLAEAGKIHPDVETIYPGGAYKKSTSGTSL